MKTVCIMQPAYLPWMGYLDMIDQADLFVLLDTVAVARQSWQTRNRVLDRSGSVVWLPIPVYSTMGQRLDTVKIAEDGRWRRKHSRTLASLGEHLPPKLLWLYEPRWDLLLDFTVSVLKSLCWELKLSTPMVFASDLGLPDSLGADERVAAIFDAFAATELLNTQGAQAYSVPLRWHEYEPAAYPQNGAGFVPYMSVVDCLARHGSEETMRVIRSGRS